MAKTSVSKGQPSRYWEVDLMPRMGSSLPPEMERGMSLVCHVQFKLGLNQTSREGLLKVLPTGCATPAENITRMPWEQECRVHL